MKNKPEQKIRKLSKAEQKRMTKAFSIISLSREDLIHPEIGYTIDQALRVTEAQMERITRKMADDYCEQLFWGSLRIIADSVIE